MFNIGTNDLVKYCLAADRRDPAVSHLDEPFHPAVLRMVRGVQRVGRRHGVRVAVCGEMAAEPTALALLIGLGVTEFSMRPNAIPEARRTVERLRFKDAQSVARRAIRGATASDVRGALDGLAGTGEAMVGRG